MAEGHWVTVAGRPVYIDRKGRRATTSLSQMSRQSEDRSAAREREAKAATYYGVFYHSIDGKPTGRGVVVRPTDATGKAHDSRNYGSGHIGKLYKQRKAAERAAEAKNAQIESDERIYRSHQ